MILAMTVAAAYAATCAGLHAPSSAAERSADAARVAAVSKQPVTAQGVGTVLSAPGWRLVWAQPQDAEPGVFLFRAQGAGWRYLDVWGGVATDRKETLDWAVGRAHMPPRLAACFTDQLMLEGP